MSASAAEEPPPPPSPRSPEPSPPPPPLPFSPDPSPPPPPLPFAPEATRGWPPSLPPPPLEPGAAFEVAGVQFSPATETGTLILVGLGLALLCCVCTLATLICKWCRRRTDARLSAAGNEALKFHAGVATDRHLNTLLGQHHFPSPPPPLPPSIREPHTLPPQAGSARSRDVAEELPPPLPPRYQPAICIKSRSPQLALNRAEPCCPVRPTHPRPTLACHGDRCGAYEPRAAFDERQHQDPPLGLRPRRPD